MNVIILAAGRGTRIAEVTDGSPKSFLRIGGKRIIEHQLDTVRSANPNEIVVVTGYRAPYVERELASSGATFVRNPFYDRTNVLGSAYFAADHMEPGFYYMHADTYFEPTIFGDLVRHPGELVLVVERKDRPVDEEMKVRLDEDHKVVEISKTMPNERGQGEFIGLLKVGPGIAPRAAELVRRFVEVEGKADEYFEVVVQQLIDEGVPADIVEVGTRLSIEIDFPEDYEEALRRYDGTDLR